MKISAVISDVDGTLVTDQAVLTDRAIAAVAALRERGIAFSMISGRAPRGLSMLIERLGIDKPVSGFNGGAILSPTLTVLRQHVLSPEAARRTVDILTGRGADAWVYSGNDWLVRNASAPHVDHERIVLGFSPTVVDDFGAALDNAAKIVGISDDFELLARCEVELQTALPDAFVARSHPYHMDVTHHLANKGEGVTELSRLLKVPLAEIAVIGDGGNDTLMFEQAGLSIAMGNAPAIVQQAADHVTDRNGDEGFAKAIERFILDKI